MSKIQLSLSVVFLFLLLSSVFAQEQAESKLRLFIQGGARLPDSSREIFVRMAGGENAHLVMIPTATSDSNLPTKAELDDTWGKFGIRQITLLHTRDPNIANDAEFLKPFETATAVWIGGGDQRRLSESYSQTAVETKLRELANRGIVIGGSSAGAAIQSSVMIQGGRETPEIGTGFNLLPNAIVDQHFLERSRLNRLARAVETHPGRTGIGISESTSLVVDGDNARVIGPGFVVSIRMIGDQLDIRSYQTDSEFALKSLNLVPQELPDELLDLPGTVELFSSMDQLDDSLIKSAIEAEKFRQSYMQSGEFEPKALSLAKLVQRFLAAHAGRFEKDPTSIPLFPISIEDFMGSFGGTSEELDGTEIYAPFAGQWQGRWAEQTVKHHWSDLVQPNRETSYRVVDRNGKITQHSISSYQYAWIGDGYGLNMVANETSQDGERHYLLGYVEHLKGGDFGQVTARRPHVGIQAGEGRLVWVTEKEVFLEEVFPDITGRGDDAYSIIGFRYEISGKAMIATEGFETLYRRNPSNSGKLPEFKSFEFSRVQGRNTASSAQR